MLMNDTIEPNNKPIHQHLTIATHNIQGYNNITKRQLWLDYCISQQFDIISLTETKLAYSQYTHHTLHNNNYKCFMSNNNTTNPQHPRESSAGTIILINQSLTTYIHNIQTLQGTAIAIDLYLPHKNNFRIISTYLPNDSNINKQTQNQIILWITQAQQLNIIPVIMGDFNQDLNRPQRSILYKYLISYNFIPLIHTYHPQTST
jgi:exonuclease III